MLGAIYWLHFPRCLHIVDFDACSSDPKDLFLFDLQIQYRMVRDDISLTQIFCSLFGIKWFYQTLISNFRGLNDHIQLKLSMPRTHGTSTEASKTSPPASHSRYSILIKELVRSHIWPLTYSPHIHRLNYHLDGECNVSQISTCDVL